MPRDLSSAPVPELATLRGGARLALPAACAVLALAACKGTDQRFGEKPAPSVVYVPVPTETGGSGGGEPVDPTQPADTEGAGSGGPAASMDAAVDDSAICDAGASCGTADASPCAVGNGGCASHRICTDTAEGASCGACADGYVEGDAAACVDVDECLTDNGGCDTSPMATCVDNEGAPPSCMCPAGTSGSGVGEAGCQTCTPEAVRCGEKGDAVERCDASGLWVEQEQCSGPGQVCVDGACKPCAAPLLDCDGLWADGCEVNGDTNPNHCGGCGEACSPNHLVPRCTDGNCDGTCQGAWQNCNGNKRSDGCETDTSSTAAHCGACAQGCDAGVSCVQSSCMGGGA